MSENEKEYTDAFAEAAAKRAAPEAEGIEASEVDDGEGHEGTEGQEADPYEGIAPAVAERLKALEAEKLQLEHRLKSDGGRVAAYQRQVNELSEKLQQAIDTGQRQSGGSDTDAPDLEQVAEAMGDEDSWSEFSAEYPEIATAIEARLNKAVATVDARLAPVESLAANSQIEKGYEYLDSTYEGWRNRVASDTFNDWINTQPEVVRKWADSDMVSEAESLIQYYDNYLLATGKMSEFQKPAGKSPQDKGNNDTADALARKRQRQLEDGDAIDSRGAGVGISDGGPAGEFSSAFQAFAKRAERKRA